MLLGILGVCGVLSITAVYIPSQASKMNNDALPSTHQMRSNSMWKNMDAHVKDREWMILFKIRLFLFILYKRIYYFVIVLLLHLWRSLKSNLGPRTDIVVTYTVYDKRNYHTLRSVYSWPPSLPQLYHNARLHDACNLPYLLYATLRFLTYSYSTPHTAKKRGKN